MSVLRAGTTQTKPTTGMAYAEAVDKVIAEAKACFDLVLIDSPPLLSVANAVELVNDSDAAIVVLGSGESVQDHLTMLERLDQVESGVAGYVYRREAGGPRFVRRLRERSAPSPPSGAGLTGPVGPVPRSCDGVTLRPSDDL
ncbi:hypothetical protein EV646_101734 [Kribbella antiqua]|uniref:AAA domain-containing protein n=1 Tax=Kribbella antiqua TaxID=2512217 RepID=A0A4V2S5D7_9ACTN|nr:hypothetical protein [Kribbella antiqua]TCO51740.1 hypothetical protein EV646_101734 [Kribbella antiqua]